MRSACTLLALGLASVAAASVAGCGGQSSARVADRIAGAVAPCGTSGGGGGLATPVGAIALAAAGASSLTARCPSVPGGTGAAIRAPVMGGIPGVTPTRWVDPAPHSDPALRAPGRFDCSTTDGDADVIVAESLERATDVCRELTGQRCECAAR